MAPPTKTPRLQDLDALGLADYASKRIDTLLHYASWATGVDLKAHGTASALLPMAEHVRDLVHYAKTGERPKGVSDESLRNRASLVLDVIGMIEGEDEELEEALLLGLHAAQGRAHVNLGLMVPRVCLAALAGVNDRRLRQVIEARELKAPATGDVPAKAARTWLLTRGAPGFDKA